MMDIFTTKESALIHLNSTKIAAGEIRVYRYYSITGNTDSFVVIGLQDGIGPDCYQILSKRKNLIVNIDTELPDASRLIQGQVHVCPINGIYHMIYIEDSQRVNREIPDSEVYYVEDFDTGFMYYLDRYTCKKLDDYFSKVYIDLSNTNALYEPGKYPETTITVWKDNSDITGACQIGITSIGCNAIYDGSRTVRITRMTEKTAKVIIKVIYRDNTYQETWNIQKVQEGIKGADAEVWSVLSKNSFIREPDLQTTTFQVLYQSGTELSYLEIPSLQDYGFHLTYEYSNGAVGLINTRDFEFESRIDDDDTELTFCIIRLLNQESEVLSAVTLPYLPNTNSLSSGQGVYKAIVFCRSNEIPETPLGGSWDSPIPTTGQWSQDAADGPEVLWVSTRIFTTDSKTPQDATWSAPSRISNTENVEVMYSTCQDAATVGTPSTKPENWELVVTGIAYFMATRTVINGVPGLWQIFAIHGVDGDAGDYKNYIYYNSTTKPETPVGSHPDGWVDFPNTDGIWWMCVGLFSGSTDELIGTWSNPIKVTGIDGNPGQDAPYLIYQYSIGTSPIDAPTYNWSSSIPSVPRGMYLWQRSGTVIPPDIAPTSWNVPVRITGERGEDGAPGTAITIDLTNEVSSVAADYEGNVVAAATFETTQVLLYRNGNPIDLEFDRDVYSISIIPDGVRASVSKSGLVTIYDWIAPKEQDTATVVINVNYNYNTYTAVYSIQKVKSGSPGESAVLYSIIPSTNILRKVNSVISPSRLTAQVRKAVGSKLSNITNLASEGIELVYSVNGSRAEEVYNFTEGILTNNVEFVTFSLKSIATGSVIDKETVLTFESTVDLIVDLTNELSAISASETGELTEDSSFETSTVKIYYGSEEIRPINCQINVTWTNMTGTFDQSTGTITPRNWDINKLGESTGQCTLEVSYQGFTKTVTYTVTKISSGKTPVLWRIVPSVSGIKVTDNNISSESITVKVYKVCGTDQSEIRSENFRSEGIRLLYSRTFEGDNEPEAEKTYESSIPVTLRTSKVEITLYDLLDNVLDRESVYVVRDGAPGTRPDWKDYIFSKKDTQPDRPTFTKHPVSGSIDNHGQVWYDGPAPGSVDEIWWMSMAIIDGKSDEDTLLSGTSWSTPIRVTGYDGTGYECQYTNSQNLVTPPESATWTASPTTPPLGYYTWMRMRSTKNSDWNYMRVTGERGSDGNSITIKGDLVYVGSDSGRIQTNTGQEILLIGTTPYTEDLETYTGNIYIGQQIVVATEVSNGDTYLYNGHFFVCTGISGTMNTWHNIASIKGDPGESWMTYVAFASNSNGSDKAQTWSSGKTYIGVAVVNTADYPDWDSVGAELYTWAEFYGKEGIGNEFIFARNNSYSEAPELNENETVNDKTRLDDEYIPRGWTDDPQPVEDIDGHRVQWISTRQKTGGSWGAFSAPVIWNRWAKDGTGISVKGVLQNVGSETNFQNYILTDSYVHGTSTTCHGRLFINGSEVTNVSNGDTYSYDGYFFICAGSTSGVYDWSVMKAKGDDGRSFYVFIRYSATSGSSGTMSDIWSPGMRYIGFATTDSNTVPAKGEFVWSEFLGQDGVGQEFIYCLSDTLTQAMRGVSGISTSASASESSNNKAFQDDEFLPGSSYAGDNQWTDNPQSVSEETGKQRQWISSRVKRGNQWGQFSVPSLWSEISESAYNLTLGNQNLDAVLTGVGVVRPSVSNSSIETAIVNGDCAGTTVSYLKGDQEVTSTFTVTTGQNVSVYVYSGNSWQSFTGSSNSNITGSTSNFEIFLVCLDKSVNQWTATITSADGVSKIITVTRAAFAPSISLGVSSYVYDQDNNENVTYVPSKTTPISITYLSNGKPTTLGIFESYGYYVHVRYVDAFGSAGGWTKITTSTTLTLGFIVGSRNPSDGSIEFEVSDISDNSQSHQVFYRESISIVANADLESVKTYLLSGDAAITGHLWAQDGKIGNWIINALDTNASTIYLADGTTVLAEYDSTYPVGSLRSVDSNSGGNQGILLNPNRTSENSSGDVDWHNGINIWDIFNQSEFKLSIGVDGILSTVKTRRGSVRTYTPFNLNSDGTGSLANGNISWDDEGTISGPVVSVTDNATDNAWKFETNGDIKTYKKFIATEYSGDATDYYKTVVDSGKVTVDMCDDSDLYRTEIRGQDIKLTTPGVEYCEIDAYQIKVDDGEQNGSCSIIEPTKVTTPEVYTPQVTLSNTNSSCYITSISPYTNTYLTRIISGSGVYLEGGPVTVGNYNSDNTTTYNYISASSFNQISDERLKSKISDITLTSEQISEAPSILYHWKSDESKTRRVGTIAQYWQEILPEVVTEDPNGNLGLNYSELSTISVISLAKEIVALKKRIEELENHK